MLSQHTSDGGVSTASDPTMTPRSTVSGPPFLRSEPHLGVTHVLGLSLLTHVSGPNHSSTPLAAATGDLLCLRGYRRFVVQPWLGVLSERSYGWL